MNKKPEQQRLINKGNFESEILKITNRYVMEPEAIKLIHDVGKTLHYYFKQGGKPLYPAIVHDLVEDYLDNKFEKDFTPPEGEAYLYERLKELKILHKHKRLRVQIEKSPSDYSGEVSPYNTKILEWLGDRKLEELNKKDMHFVLDNIGPKEKMYSGTLFLKLLLESEGPESLINFVEKSCKLLDKEGHFESYDFGPSRTKFIKKTQPNRIGRRGFFRTVGWSYPGLIEIVVGALMGMSQLNRYFGHGEESDNEEQKKRLDIYTRIRHWIEESPITSSGLVIIGGALNVESYMEWKHMKLEHLERVANAVSEMGDLIEQQAKGSKVSPAL